MKRNSSATRNTGNRVKTGHVVCAIDSQMVLGLAVLLSSMKNQTTQQFVVTIGYLEGNLPRRDRNFLQGIAHQLKIKVSFQELVNRRQFIRQGHISPTTFTKFLLSDIFETPHVWIDADAVALPGWDQIFQQLEGCSDSESLVVAARGTSKKPSKDGPSGLAFNAGVLGWPAGKRKDWETPLSDMGPVATQEQFLFNQLYSNFTKTISEKFNLLTYRVDSLEPSEMPFIIHYAGAHKPWHLRRDLTHGCLNHICPWSAWFRAEKRLMEEIRATELEPELTVRQKDALRSGRIQARRDHSGYNLLRALTALGPMAGFVIKFLSTLKQWIPRGTHPIH